MLTRNRFFWIGNLVGGILVIFSCGLKMNIAQFLSSLFFFDISNDFLVGIMFLIFGLFMIIFAIAEKTKFPDSSTLRNYNVTLAVIGILFIGITVLELLASIVNEPSLVWSIPAFLAGGIALVSGIVGLFRA